MEGVTHDARGHNASSAGRRPGTQNDGCRLERKGGIRDRVESRVIGVDEPRGCGDERPRQGARILPDRCIRGMDEPEAPKDDKYVETARDRRIANALLLFFLIVVVGGGIWLANAMFEQRRLDDCLAQGGRHCAPAIDAPAR